MATLSAALALAVEHHQAGRLAMAEEIYQRVLAVEPDQPDAWHLWGVVACQTGNYAAGIERLQRAIALNGGAAVFHHNLADAYRHLGQPAEAAACYRRALQLKPNSAKACNSLGMVLQEQGRVDEAVACYRRALDIQPNYAEAHNNLGSALQEQGNVADAIHCWRRALALKADFAEAHFNLGNGLREQGQLDNAIACYQKALELKPDYAKACNNLGNAMEDRGQVDEAAACYVRALELKPDFAPACNNLGNVLQAKGRLDEAVACYRRALQIAPEFGEAQNNLGNALKAQGQLDEAIACYRRCLDRKPDFTAACNNLGNALKEQGRLDEAAACYRRCLALDPAFAEAHYNLGNTLRDQGKPYESLACYRAALGLQPDYADAYNNLGNALKDQGLIDEAVACYRRLVQLKPDYVAAHSNLLDALHYRPSVSPAELAAAHREFDEQHAAPLGAWRAHANDRNAERPLRLGFLSPDLHRHPVAALLVRALEHLDREQFEIVCYHDQTRRDALTARFQAAASAWREVHALGDEPLAEQIRADRIDILFDLAGHTAHNRLLVFARKPAPVQITWIGYEGTTGLAAMDYLIADRHVIPPGEETHYREQILRMPDGYVCFDPPVDAPPVGPLPAAASRRVTFASFNNLAKIGAEVVRVWAEILRRTPHGQLALKYRGLGDEMVRRRYLDLFAAHGVGSERLTLLPPCSYAEYLAAYQQVDIALDPFPFSGSATTCEALWMGVPVITCPGPTFAGRHGLTHLANIGLEEAVANGIEEYVALAVRWAADLPRLAEVRASLRERMAASPLCDGARFAANLTELLRNAWRIWVAGA